MNAEKAIRFIKENGTALEKYRLGYLLGKEKSSELPLRYLRKLQNDDGGFPYNSEKGKESSVNVTSSNLDLLIELELGESDICKKTLEWLRNTQGEDGSWDENKAITQYSPPFWDVPGDFKTKMWLTASISNDLIKLSYGKSQAVRKATEFLLTNRDEEGKFAGFLHSTWIAVGVFGQLEGADSEIVKKALRVIDKNLSRMEDGASDFIWCLECCHAAGISKEESVVKKCISRVIGLQRENGAWASIDGERYIVSTTISALRVLKMYRVWER